MTGMAVPHSARIGLIGLGAALVLGAVLRLAWVRDMEYKLDEAWTFDRTQSVGRTEPWLWRGMLSSAGLDNPGMSFWVFWLLARLFDVHEPTELARAVQLVNVGAIVLLALFVWRCVPEAEREPWLWAVALLCVNPLAVVLHRKIWPQSILPIFSLMFLAGWWYRQRRGGAFLWGLIGALIGQVHMGGFLLAAGFVGWVLLFDRKGIRWRSWLVGSCLGALPLVPWLYYMVVERPGRSSSEIDPWVLLEFRYWLNWSTDPVGAGPFGLEPLRYSLREHFPDFLTYPLFDGRPTHLVWALNLLLIVTWVVLMVRLGYLLWRNRWHLRERFIGRSSQTAFTLSAALWGYGILLTLTLIPVARHYMIILFPLEFVWLARLILAGGDQSPTARRLGRGVLVMLFVAQLLISASFLGYIHVNQGAVGGDYDVPYGAQPEPLKSPR
jgi:4-amino-4-deoxy-L-arabinose transferase-like glycosyltransferase